MILKCIRTAAMAALAMVSINVSGQDLLARQAPIDRKLKAVDSLALIRQIKAEQAVYPAYSLYPNWNNRQHMYESWYYNCKNLRYCLSKASRIISNTANIIFKRKQRFLYKSKSLLSIFLICKLSFLFPTFSHIVLPCLTISLLLLDSS